MQSTLVLLSLLALVVGAQSAPISEYEDTHSYGTSKCAQPCGSADQCPDGCKCSGFLCVKEHVEELAAVGDDSTCGDKPSTVADCDHPDLGSCGNSCCVVEFEEASDPTAQYQMMRTWFDVYGPEHGYAYQNTSDAAGHNPSDDLRPYKIPGGYQYIMQVTHTTKGGYVDKVDMYIKATKTGSLIRAFSSSGIHGALGDHGQNYKNIAFFVSKLATGHFPLKPVFGCGLE
jgi:hypothetical protein